MGRLVIRLSALLVALSACVQAAQRYPLVAGAQARGARGSLQVERIEGGEKLVMIELENLAPPERMAAGVREFVVWLESDDGARRRAGVLRYDGARKVGHLTATTAWPRFTVRVTAEHEAHVTTPSSVLLAERKVVLN